MAGSGTRIEIELLQGGAEPQGGLSVGGGPQRPFAGWIGLISALESVVHPPPIGGTSDGPGASAAPGSDPGG